MSASWTPTKKSLARMPNMGSSFTSCFGASTPVSPRRSGGHGLLGGQACVNYQKLGFDEEEYEDDSTYTYKATVQEEEESEKEYEHVSQRRQGPSLHFGKQSTLKAKKGMHYTSEGEEQYARERKTVMKLGTQWTMREKARMEVFCASEIPKEEPYASEQEGDEYVRARKGILKLGKLWSMREKDSISYASETHKKQEHYHASDQEESDVYVRERKGVMKLGKLWTMREKARMGVYNGSLTPKEEGHNASEEEIDEYGRERKGEMQFGKQSSMREKERFYAGSPRRESLSRRVREACVQVFESARRSSPHLSELFVGNQLLMQVTSSSSSFNARRAKNVAPSAGFLVAGDPPLSIISPSSSSSSSAF